MKAQGRSEAGQLITTVIIGGGQAGLATSRCLTEHGIDHVVLERGEVANSWRRERWDSLRLLSPNWQNCLPGYHYRGSDSDGFLSMPGVIAFLDDYARAVNVPVLTGVEVTAVTATALGYRVQTSQGVWRCRSLVIASGAFNLPVVPAFGAAMPAGITSLTPHQYRNPDQLEPGGVLVVGAAASGLQIADELQRAGRQVTLAVGEHLRMPRRYRGQDIEFWMQLTGQLDESYRQVDDLQRARRLPSPQLQGKRRNLDLNSLRKSGVELVGRLAGIHGSQAQFSGSLDNATKLADLKQQRLLNSIDDWLERSGWTGKVDPAERPEPTRTDKPPRLGMDLASGEIRTVIWATGFRPDYSWLKVPVLDRRGRIRHDGGIVAAPGLYAMGLPFMRRRKSHSIFGAGDDARDISTHLADYVRSSHRSRLMTVA